MQMKQLLLWTLLRKEKILNKCEQDTIEDAPLIIWHKVLYQHDGAPAHFSIAKR